MPRLPTLSRGDKPSSRPLITVFADRYAKGWDANGPAAWEELRRSTKHGGIVGYASTAMDFGFKSDAHFVTYSASVEAMPRLKKRVSGDQHYLYTLASKGVNVRHEILAFDVDDPDAKLHKRPSTDEWRAAFDAAMTALTPPPWWYHTTHGARVVYAAPEPLAPPHYEIYLQQAMTLFATWTGYEPDPACKDWTRMYRLPRVVRDGQTQTWDVHAPGKSPGVFPLRVGPADEQPQTADEAIDAMVAAGGSFELPSQVSSGQRHGVLMSYAASLRARGLGQQEILALVMVADKRVCTPPMQDESGGKAEIAGIVEHAGRLDVADSYKAKEPTKVPNSDKVDAGDASLEYYRDRPPDVPKPFFQMGSAHKDMAEWALAVQEGTGPRMIYAEGAMWRYSSARGVWVAHDDAQLRQMAGIVNDCNVRSGDSVVNWRISDSACKGIASQMKLARANGSPLSASFPDPEPGVSFTNGFAVCTASGVSLEPHSPSHYARAQVPHNYIAKPKLTLLDKFFTQVWPDDTDGKKRETLCRFLGLCLAGRGTDMQVALLLHGDKGHNGKSTLISIIEALFPPGTLSHLSLADLSGKFLSAELQAKLANLSAEVESKAITETERLKMVITGDGFTAQRKYGHPFLLAPRAGLIFAINDLPWFDPSPALLRRFVVLSFNVKIPKSERIDRFHERVIESDIVPFASYCLQAASRYYADRAAQKPGLLVNDCSDDKALLLESDHVYRIFADIERVAYKDGVTTTQAYEYYREQARQQGVHHMLSLVGLGRRLKKLGFTKSAIRKEAPESKSGYTTQRVWDFKVPASDLFGNLMH